MILDRSYEEKFNENYGTVNADDSTHQAPQAPGVEENPRKKFTWQQNFFKDAKDILVIIGVFMLVYVLFFRAVVVVGNSMNDTLVWGDRLLVLSGSHIAMQGTPDEVFCRAHELVEIGLDIPEITRVFMRLQALGLPVKPVYTMEQAIAALKQLKEGK